MSACGKGFSAPTAREATAQLEGIAAQLDAIRESAFHVRCLRDTTRWSAMVDEGDSVAVAVAGNVQRRLGVLQELLRVAAVVARDLDAVAREGIRHANATNTSEREG